MKGQRKQFPAGKRLRFRFELAAVQLLAWLVPKFPRNAVRKFGRALGWMTFYLAPALRRIALQNLDAAFGDSKSREDKRRIAHASLQSIAATLLCLFWAPRLTRDVIEQIVEVDRDSLERTHAIQARGKGIIFITLHYGDWELLGLATAAFGVPMTVIQETMRNESLESIFARLRGATGNRLVPNRFAATTLLKTLKRGDCIALLIDQNATRKRGGVWLEFFGLPAFSHSAMGALALHTGAAMVGGVAHPLPDGRVRIVYGPEIKWQRTGDDAQDARTINQACLRFCEDVIRAAPEHWMWCYKRWSPRATSEQGRYPAYSRYRPDIAPAESIV